MENCEQTPLTDLLKQVPRDCRLTIPFQWNEEGAETGHHMIPIGRLAHEAADENTRLRADLERERMRLVACGVVATADTPDSAKEARLMHNDYQSPSCDDVARRVDECIRLRAEVEAMTKQLREALAACKAYREALVAADECIKFYSHPGSMLVAKALAIQPDDAALMAWYREQLGGPVRKAIEALRFIANNPRPAGGQEEFNTEDLHFRADVLEKLYLPKGVKK